MRITSTIKFNEIPIISGKYLEGIYLTSLNYNTGRKSSLGEKNTIIEALKEKDINNINNNSLISIGSYDKLIKYRQFY